MSDLHAYAIKFLRHFRKILLWPLQLRPIRAGAPIQGPWDVLK